jgi:membrane protease YdiL (CAAX protease family)
MNRTASGHAIVLYVVVAYAASWSWWVPMALAGLTTRPGQGWPTHLPGLVGAAIGAVVATAVADGTAGLRDLGSRVWRWRVPARWYGLVAITAAMLVLAPVARHLAGQPPPTATEYATYSGVAVLPLPVTVLAVLVLNGFGEETGWRGFLVDRLLQRHSVVRTALVVAPIWAFWHAPMFFCVASLSGLGIGGTIGWFLGLTGGSILLTWLYVASGRSIAVTALWHTAFNFTTATAAATGAPAAVASTLVMVAAVTILAHGSRLEAMRHH